MTLPALDWTVNGELVHVQDYTVSLFQSGWFGNKKFFAATLERAQPRQDCAAHKNICCCSESNKGMTVLSSGGIGSKV